MKLVLIFLCLATIAFCTLWFITYLTLKKNYKYYKPTYEAIKNKEYLLYRNDQDFITFRPKDKMDIPIWVFNDDEILYFKENDTIKLTKGYIHKDFMPFFDPYTQYWHNKIKKQITINSSLENMREDKLKQLLK
jgi:hypothetical protein